RPYRQSLPRPLQQHGPLAGNGGTQRRRNAEYAENWIPSFPRTRESRKRGSMYKALSPGAMGLKVGSLKEAIDVASKAGFEGVEFGIHEVADLVAKDGAESVKAMFSSAGLKPAGWGLPTDWRGDESKWRADLEALPRLASAAMAIGCHRTMTWIM